MGIMASASQANAAVSSAAAGACAAGTCAQRGQLRTLPAPSWFLVGAAEPRAQAQTGGCPRFGPKPERLEPGPLPALAPGSSSWHGAGQRTGAQGSRHRDSWTHQGSAVSLALSVHAVVRGTINTVTP